jgi:uncharacterized protein (DUF1684 family)
MQHLLITLLLLPFTPMTISDEPNYAQSVELWRANRLERLKAPDGWLAVSGLVWLRDGEFSFGSAETNPIALANGSCPEMAGNLQVRGDSVTFATAKDVEVLLNSKPVATGELRIDNTKPESDSPDKLVVGRTSLHLIRRSNKLAIRLRDPESALIRNFPGEDWYPVDPKWKVQAKFTPFDSPRSIQITNVKGQTHDGELIGFVEFSIDGQTIRLDVQAESPKELFLNFKDATSGKETYGAGRMLNAPMPVDGMVELDFNKAYNPPCAYNTFTLCPLPPKQNHLSIAINAGAKKPKE